MESSYHGFFVGPTSSSQSAEAAMARALVRRGRAIESRDGKVWIAVEQAHEAEALACAIGDGTWLWEIELRNDNDFEDERGESHSGTICGHQRRAGELELRTRDDFSGESFIRGGVMEEVALEYVHEYTRIETEVDRELDALPGPGPSALHPPRPRPRAQQPDELAPVILEHLLAHGDLEIVNHHARRTLLAPVERCLLEPNAASTAAAILTVLEDADEVVEVYADEAELAALIAELRGRRSSP